MLSALVRQRVRPEGPGCSEPLGSQLGLGTCWGSRKARLNADCKVRGARMG